MSQKDMPLLSEWQHSQTHYEILFKPKQQKSLSFAVEP